MIYLNNEELTDLVKKAGITAQDAQEAADNVKNTSITIVLSTKKVQRVVHNGLVSLKYGCPLQKMALKGLILVSLLPENEESYGIDLGDNLYARWSRDVSNLVGGLSFKLPTELHSSESKVSKPDTSVDDDDGDL